MILHRLRPARPCDFTMSEGEDTCVTVSAKEESYKEAERSRSPDEGLVSTMDCDARRGGVLDDGWSSRGAAAGWAWGLAEYACGSDRESRCRRSKDSGGVRGGRDRPDTRRDSCAGQAGSAGGFGLLREVSG